MRTAIGVALCLLSTIGVRADDERTYAGRTYDEWSRLAVNDLDPATRAKAMKAIGVLGHHGHRDDALTALKRSIKMEKKEEVLRGAYVAILTFGPDAVEPIEQGFGDEERLGAALEAVAEFYFIRSGVPIETRQAVPSEKVVPLLLALMKDKDADLTDRRQAGNSLQDVIRLHGPQPFVESALPALVEVAKAEDTELASEAITAIGRLGEHAVSAVPMLIEMAATEERPQRSRRQRMLSRQLSAISALGAIGPPAKAAIPTLEALARDSDNTRRFGGTGGMSAQFAERTLQRIRGESNDGPRR